MNEKKDWADERLRRIIEQAKGRRQVFREIDLAEFDAEGLSGQQLRVWVNAPSLLARNIAELDLSSGDMASAIAEYLSRPTGEPYTASDFQDLLDAWEGPLRLWVVRKVFDTVSAYAEERRSFFASSRTDGPSKDNLTSETSSAPASSSSG